MSPATSRHRPTILASATDLIAEHGARALTHATVDDAAGLPRGTTSNYFRTRTALLGGVLDHLVEADEEAVAAVAGGDLPHDADGVVDLAVRMADHLSGPARTLSRARYALFVEASAHPELAARVAAAHERLEERARVMVRAAGAADPVGAASLLVTLLDGLVLARVCYGARLDARELVTPVVATIFELPAG